MQLTAVEKKMYEVMKAIYDSGIPISFKGSMVLKACLLEAGYSEEARHTIDIDANWNADTPPSAEQMTESLQKALQNSEIDLNVNLYRMFADKLSAISTEKVFRRIKDVVDLYYLSNTFSFNCADVRQVLKNSGRTLGNFSDFLYGTDALRHAYEKFRFEGGVRKPPFDEVYESVINYIKDEIPNRKPSHNIML